MLIPSQHELFELKPSIGCHCAALHQLLGSRSHNTYAHSANAGPTDARSDSTTTSKTLRASCIIGCPLVHQTIQMRSNSAPVQRTPSPYTKNSNGESHKRWQRPRLRHRARLRSSSSASAFGTSTSW